jgi:outer membrane biosynthesis protein TonB
MTAVPPPTTPVEPGDASNRWPWVALILALLVILVASAFFVFNRSQTVNIGVEGTPSPNPVARAGTASPGPPPTLPASASVGPTPTPVPAPTNTPVPPTPSPAPTQPPPTQPPPTQPPVEAAPPAAGATPAPGATQPGQPEAAAPGTATPAGGAPASTATSAPTTAAPPPSPTPFAGQVANAGGLGNTRSDIEAAFGAPTGETPEHLVAYRKDNVEYHVGFVPDNTGRAALIVELPQQPLALEQAQSEAHKLLPKDAQPPNPTAEGNNQFAVERYTSQTLAQALPPAVFTANNGQPGQFLIVYVKDQQERIARMILGPGNDPNALINQGR